MFRISSRMIETKPFDVTRDAWRIMQRRAMEAVGRHWFDTYFREHFTANARWKYRYQARARQYNARKQRQAANPNAKVRVLFGGHVDLVYTGTMMKAVLAGAIIRGFPTRVKVSMFGPPHMKIRFRNKRQPDKKAEMTAVTNEEVTDLKRVLRGSIDNDLKRFRARRESKL